MIERKLRSTDLFSVSNGNPFAPANYMKTNTFKVFLIVIFTMFCIFSLFFIYHTESYADGNNNIVQDNEGIPNETIDEGEVLVNSNNGMKIAFIIIGVCILAIPVIIIILIIKWFVRKQKK